MAKHPLNLALRFILEMAGLTVFGIWGWSWGEGWWRILPAVIVPLLFATFWGVFAVNEDPSRSGKTVIPTKGVVRLFLEFTFFGLAALALFDMNLKSTGIVFALVVLFHYAASYDRIIWLLKH